MPFNTPYVLPIVQQEWMGASDFSHGSAPLHINNVHEVNVQAMLVSDVHALRNLGPLIGSGFARYECLLAMKHGCCQGQEHSDTRSSSSADDQQICLQAALKPISSWKSWSNYWRQASSAIFSTACTTSSVRSLTWQHHLKIGRR